MKFELYGKRMFIADLCIVTLWGVFMCQFSLHGHYGVMFLYLIRAALSFEMERKSKWTLFSAITFALAFLGGIDSSWFSYPAHRMVDYFYVIANEGYGFTIFHGNWHTTFTVLFYIVEIALCLWLVALPLAVGISLKNINNCLQSKVWTWIYMVLAIIPSIIIGIVDIPMGIIFGGMFLSFTPVVNWLKYERQGRSLVDVMAKEKYIKRYVITILILAVYSLVLHSHIDGYSFWGLLSLPPLFYILLLRWNDIQPLTRHAVALSLAGLICELGFLNTVEDRLYFSAFSFLLTIYVALDVAIRLKHPWLGAAILLGVGIGCPVLAGCAI